MKSTIVFLDGKKGKFFADELLHDPRAKRFLNMNGASEADLERFRSGQWKAGFCKEKEGYVIISTYAASARCTIDSLYVVKNLRRKGYAKELIEFAEKFCRDNWRNLKTIDLFTIEGCTTEKFIASMGYENKGVYKDYYGKGMHQTLWAKDL